MSDQEYQPLTGDPDTLTAAAQRYQGVAEAIARSVKTLHAIHGMDGMTSKAVEALKKTSEDVANDIQKAHDRYSTTSSALLTYAGALRTAQSDAASAISAINTAQGNVDSANKAAAAASTAATQATATGSTASQADQDEATRKAKTTQQTAEDAAGDLRAAQQRWRDALAAKTSAANTAHDQIEDVVNRHNHGLKNPSWWQSALSAVYSALKTICDIAGILSVFLAWVPGLGEILLALAAVGAILDVIQSVVNVINGTGSWWDVGFAVAGAALTLFGGKIFELAAKGLKAGMVAESGITATRTLARFEGVGAHSTELMDVAGAQKVLDASVSSKLTAVFKSPLVRNEGSQAIFDAVKSGKISVTTALKMGLTNALPSMNSDLVSVAKMAAERPDLVTTGVKVTTTAAYVYQVHEIQEKIGHFTEIPENINETVEDGKEAYENGEYVWEDARG